jgi:hypothetical protein
MPAVPANFTIELKTYEIAIGWNEVGMMDCNLAIDVAILLSL